MPCVAWWNRSTRRWNAAFRFEALKWRIEALRTGRPFGEIVLMRSLRYRVEQVFLIHRETGLLLQHVARSGQGVQDSDLVSGMLTAIQDFVRDSFTGTSGKEIETIELGEFNLWIQHGPAAILAVVVSGTPPPELRFLLERTLERVHADYATPLASFQGDAAAFAACAPPAGVLLARPAGPEISPPVQAVLRGLRSRTAGGSWPARILQRAQPATLEPSFGEIAEGAGHHPDWRRTAPGDTTSWSACAIRSPPILPG